MSLCSDTLREEKQKMQRKSQISIYISYFKIITLIKGVRTFLSYTRTVLMTVVKMHVQCT